ncbi:hypothetical protein HYDPIDRAFT_110879 [Hydnomerulius pinastri MD-312]|nr:hypothetical protein HYDPIDRAFT_110879 [Hydnomerulius pinastri MD-312]
MAKTPMLQKRHTQTSIKGNQRLASSHSRNLRARAAWDRVGWINPQYPLHRIMEKGLPVLSVELSGRAWRTRFRTPPIKGKGKHKADELTSLDALDSPAQRRFFRGVNLKGFKSIKGISKPFKSARKRKKLPASTQSTSLTPPGTQSGPPTTSTKSPEARLMTPVPSMRSPEGAMTQPSGARSSRPFSSLSLTSWSRSRPRPQPIPVHEIAAARPKDFVGVGEGPPSPIRRRFPRSLKPSPKNKPWHKYALKAKEKLDKKAAEESDGDSSSPADSVASQGRRKASPAPPPSGVRSGTTHSGSQQGAQSAGPSTSARASPPCTRI